MNNKQIIFKANIPTIKSVAEFKALEAWQQEIYRDLMTDVNKDILRNAIIKYDRDIEQYHFEKNRIRMPMISIGFLGERTINPLLEEE